MSRIYSDVLLDADVFAGVPASSIVIPATETWVVRHITALNFGGTADQLYVFSQLEWLYVVLEAPANSDPVPWAQWEGRAVLKSGDQLTANPNSGEFAVHVSGYRLVGP